MNKKHLGYRSICLFQIIMPRRRNSNISQQTRNTIVFRNIANQYTEEERENAREECRVSMGRVLAHTEEQREEARETAQWAMDRVAPSSPNHRAWSTASIPNAIHENSWHKLLLAMMVNH